MGKDDLRFDGPGRYLILIKEKVSQDICEMFPLKDAQDDLVKLTRSGYQYIIDVKDQSELMSILNVFYDHHYTLIKTEFISQT